SSRRRHTRFSRDWSTDVCSSDLALQGRTTSPTSLSGEGFDEAELEQAPYSAQTFASTAKTMVRYLAGDYRGAVDAADARSPLPRSEEQRVGKECRSGWPRTGCEK